MERPSPLGTTMIAFRGGMKTVERLVKATIH